MADNISEESFLRNKSRLLGTALALILLSFFVINVGVRDGEWVTWMGLALLFIGMLLPPVSRFTAGESGSGGDGEEQDKEAK